jgi:hypothetical protein
MGKNMEMNKFFQGGGAGREKPSGNPSLAIPIQPASLMSSRDYRRHDQRESGGDFNRPMCAETARTYSFS